jgi:hypothetical protein
MGYLGGSVRLFQASKIPCSHFVGGADAFWDPPFVQHRFSEKPVRGDFGIEIR